MKEMMVIMGDWAYEGSHEGAGTEGLMGDRR